MRALVSRFWQVLEKRCGLSVFRVMERPLRRAEPAAHPLVSLRLMCEADVLPLCADPELELDPARVSAAVARGDACIGAFAGDRLVAYRWIATGPTPHTGGLWVEFAPDARYTYKSFVRPAYRGCRINPAVNLFSDAACIARGLTRAISLIGVTNGSSLRNSMRSGHRVAGYVGFARILGHTLFFRSPGARRRGPRFFAKQAPSRQKAYRSEWQRQRRLRH